MIEIELLQKIIITAGLFGGCIGFYFFWTKWAMVPKHTPVNKKEERGGKN